MEITFTILGDPKAQKRHRTYTKGKGGLPLPFARQVDPSATDKADFLAQCRQHAPEAPLTGPLSLEVGFLFARPKSHYRTGKHAGELKENRPIWHTSRPDADNLVKMCKDAMNGVFYRDDCQVVTVTASKIYSDAQPFTTITLRELSNELDKRNL